MDECPHCSQEFFNELEVQQHIEQVHGEKWEGNANFSQNADENAVGAVPENHPDQIATEGGRVRPEVDRAGHENEPPADTPHREKAEKDADERYQHLIEEPEER